MKPLTPEARALLEAGRDFGEPGSLDQDRVWSGLAARLEESGARPAKALTPGKALGLAVVVLALGGALIFALRDPEPAPLAAAVQEQAAATSAPEAQATTPISGQDVQRAAPRPTAPRRDAVPEDPLALELELMRRIKQALLAEDWASALSLLDQHARRFPSGLLRPEASIGRMKALAATGREEEARALAVRFLSEHPSSALSPQARSYLERPPP